MIFDFGGAVADPLYPSQHWSGVKETEVEILLAYLCLPPWQWLSVVQRWQKVALSAVDALFEAKFRQVRLIYGRGGHWNSAAEAIKLTPSPIADTVAVTVAIPVAINITVAIAIALDIPI